ncbi:coenzyme F420-0:L-glutamate ligase [Candidatus Parcubacteria bacterium]|nr:coenzyme F420-0:L-glutamate ligase [Candidatus Parcubacteria bacterium]
MEPLSNPQKKLIVNINKEKWARYPIKTHFIETKDRLENIIERYILPFTQKNDIIVLCQKIVAITQGKIVYKKDIKVSHWAKFLSKFVQKTPYGFSVGNPLKMQLAINLAGLPRILLASFLGGFAKIFGIKGVFYRIAGHQINQIDGFYAQAFPQYAEMGILGFKNLDNFCNKLKEKYGFSFVAADINDLGGNILGKTDDLESKNKLLLQILKDNPAGQSNEQTPIIILRKSDNYVS